MSPFQNLIQNGESYVAWICLFFGIVACYVNLKRDIGGTDKDVETLEKSMSDLEGRLKEKINEDIKRLDRENENFDKRMNLLEKKQDEDSKKLNAIQSDIRVILQALEYMKEEVKKLTK